MGGLEFIEKKEGFSYGANDMRDGVSIHQERRREPVVKEAEFSELPDLHAFLKLPGSWPVTQIEFKYKKRVFTQLYFIPRDVKEMPFSEILEEPELPKHRDEKTELVIEDTPHLFLEDVDLNA